MKYSQQMNILFLPPIPQIESGAMTRSFPSPLSPRQPQIHKISTHLYIVISRYGRDI